MFQLKTTTAILKVISTANTSRTKLINVPAVVKFQIRDLQVIKWETFRLIWQSLESRCQQCKLMSRVHTHNPNCWTFGPDNAWLRLPTFELKMFNRSVQTRDIHSNCASIHTVGELVIFSMFFPLLLMQAQVWLIWINNGPAGANSRQPLIWRAF